MWRQAAETWYAYLQQEHLLHASEDSSDNAASTCLRVLDMERQPPHDEAARQIRENQTTLMGATHHPTGSPLPAVHEKAAPPRSRGSRSSGPAGAARRPTDRAHRNSTLALSRLSRLGSGSCIRSTRRAPYRPSPNCHCRLPSPPWLPPCGSEPSIQRRPPQTAPGSETCGPAALHCRWGEERRQRWWQSLRWWQ